MTRSKTGQAIRPERLTKKELGKLRKFIDETERSNDLKSWRRAIAVLNYIEGKKVVAIKDELNIVRLTGDHWNLLT